MTTAYDDPRRWWALAALGLAVLTLGFDITIMNVALPTIATELEVGTDGLQWMVNAYVLVIAGLMLTCGALGDRYGRKRLLLIGLGVFGVSSAAAAGAGSSALVIAARGVMGMGAAIMMPVAFAVLAALFGPAERGRAVSFLVMGLGIGIPLGPIIGGYLLEHFWWGSIFLINVPIAIAAAIAIAVLLPESRDPSPRRPDVLGAVLSTAGLSALVYGVIEAPGRGWSDSVTLGAITAGVVVLTGFVAWELRVRDPMIDLHLFARPQFLWGSIAGVLVTFGMLGLLFVVPQYLQFVAGHDAFATGIRLLPLIGGLVLGAPAGERLAARAGYRAPVSAGLAVLAAGVAIGARTDLQSSYRFVAAWLATAGLGIGMALAPAMDAVLDALPTEQAGSGTAITMTLRQTGGALGVALLGSLLAEGYTARVNTAGLRPEAAAAARESIAGALAAAARFAEPSLASNANAAYLHGMSLVLIATAITAGLSALLAALLLTGKPTASGDHNHRSAQATTVIADRER
ncbi:MFS transporter [Pimelobacter simplex]|uniref:MFS transporter n=1 Tax=Nocardioides simplex TaxID=2045 RepID=A0A7J5DYD7_NOCSI|nr:MFS transporter [Pimelobacter simplex]KAB2811042.1 MFS transporter [Pimelobacter simplex]